MVGFKVSELQINLSLLGLGGGTITWARNEGDRKIARDVIVFLEDRRLLFGRRHDEDEMHCVISANQIRQFLGAKIAEADPGRDLEGSLRAMRQAARRFVDAAGPDASEFRGERGAGLFALALGELQGRIGGQLAVLAHAYDLEIEWQLAAILPAREPDDEGDYSWIPGFPR